MQCEHARRERFAKPKAFMNKRRNRFAQAGPRLRGHRLRFWRTRAEQRHLDRTVDASAKPGRDQWFQRDRPPVEEFSRIASPDRIPAARAAARLSGAAMSTSKWKADEPATRAARRSRLANVPTR